MTAVAPVSRAHVSVAVSLLGATTAVSVYSQNLHTASQPCAKIKLTLTLTVNRCYQTNTNPNCKPMLPNKRE